jgi:carbonic anhydrase/acetyltransferase-like protein (isoleucine patch superfamily)
MLIEHSGRRPHVDPSAYVAPNAVLCGDVRVGADARILYGAVLNAEDGHIEIGARCLVMENAVVRGRADHPTNVGDDVLIGPHAHINGARVGNGCFLATGCFIVPGAVLGNDVEVRIHGTVHVNSQVAAGTVVPIGWVAVGRPAQVFPPDAHEEIWALQEPLDFPKTVYGIERGTPARELMDRLSQRYGMHRGDRVLDGA